MAELSGLFNGFSESSTLQNEVNRHKAMLVTKLLHETQHEVTALFLSLPRVVTALSQKGSLASSKAARIPRHAEKENKRKFSDTEVVLERSHQMITRSSRASEYIP